MNYAEWTKHRAGFREQVQREMTEAIDAGRGTLPVNIAINDAIIRSLIDRVTELEKRGK